MTAPLKKSNKKQSELIATMDQCIENLPKVFGTGPVGFPYSGKSYDVTAMVVWLTTLVTQLKAVSTAKSTWKDAEAAAKATRVLARAILAMIQSIAREWFGATSAQVAQLGLNPAKPRTPRTPKASTVAKRTAAAQQVAAGKASAKATRAITTGMGMVDFATGDVTLVSSGAATSASSDGTEAAAPASEETAAPAPSSAAALAKS